MTERVVARPDHVWTACAGMTDQLKRRRATFEIAHAEGGEAIGSDGL